MYHKIIIDCGIEDIKIKKICDSIKYLPNLSKFNLKDISSLFLRNNIHDNGLIELCNNFKYISNLLELNISCIYIISILIVELELLVY